MKAIPNFKTFNVDEGVTAVGFGQTGIQNIGLGGATPETGYSMTPIAGVVESCSNHVAEQAKMYESNDNDYHTAESYLKEAKKHINESMDRAYEGYGSMDEAMVQVAGSKKPAGAQVLATVIIDYLADNLLMPSNANKKKITEEIKQLIVKSTF